MHYCCTYKTGDIHNTIFYWMCAVQHILHHQLLFLAFTTWLGFALGCLLHWFLWRKKVKILIEIIKPINCLSNNVESENKLMTHERILYVDDSVLYFNLSCSVIKINALQSQFTRIILCNIRKLKHFIF